MNRSRIIFVNRVYWPSTLATAQLLTDLAEGLAARGWAVHVIATGEASTRQNGVTIHRTGTEEKPAGMIQRALGHRRFVQAARRQLAGLVKAGDLVVPMTDPPLLASGVTREAVTRGARVIPWIQDIYPEIAAVHFGPLAGFFLGPLGASRDSAWRGAAACVTLGEDMALTGTRRGVAAGNLQVIPNWAPRELHSAPSAAAVEACRQRWDLAGKFIVAYSGNLGRVHEFETILEAAAQLRSDPNVVFLFIGQGARFDEVRDTARTRGLANVRLLPPEPRENLAASLAAADAHLVTLRPGYAALVYPSKLAGVLAAGRPVLFVGPVDGDIGRLLARERCGAAFAPGDGAGLAGTIARWQSDAAGQAGLGACARAAYERSFTAGAALARWDELLHRVASAPA